MLRFFYFFLDSVWTIYVKSWQTFFFLPFRLLFFYISLTWTEIVFLLYCCKYLTIDNQPVLYEFFVIYIFQLELHFVSSLTPYRNLKFLTYSRRVYLFYLFFRNLIYSNPAREKRKKKELFRFYLISILKISFWEGEFFSWKLINVNSLIFFVFFHHFLSLFLTPSQLQVNYYGMMIRDVSTPTLFVCQCLCVYSQWYKGHRIWLI